MVSQYFFAEQGRKGWLRATVDTDAALQASLLQATQDVKGILAGLDGPGIGAQVRAMQYQSIAGELSNRIEDMWVGDMHPDIINGMRAASDAAVIANKNMLSFLMQGVTAGDAGLARSLFASDIQSWRATQMRILAQKDLSTNVYNHAALTSGKIDDIVNSGIALGQSAAEIASAVEGYINPEVMGGTRYAAQRLGRTELHNAYHAMTVESYKDNPYVNGVEWHLSGSHPEDDECDEYDGEIFPPDEVPDPPHPNCFCYISAVTPTPDEFVDNMVNGEYDGNLNDSGLTQAAMCH